MAGSTRQKRVDAFTVAREASVESRTSQLLQWVWKVRELGATRPRCFCRFFVGTEVHGLQQASSAIQRREQYFWSALIILFFLISSYTTKKMVSEYTADQTETSYSIHQVDRLEFPSIIMCPKNPDALNLDAVEAEVRGRVRQKLTRRNVTDLIGYAIADAAFTNMERFVQNLTEAEHRQRVSWLKEWRGRRNSTHFYTDLFERHGYKCEDFFSVCQLGAKRLSCCRIFEQHYVMLRGRCFRLKRLFQVEVDYHGRLYVELNRLPSPICDSTGEQPQVVAYLAAPAAEMMTYPRFYVGPRAHHSISAAARRVRLRPGHAACFPGDERRGRAACYVRRWLHARFVDAHRCAPFYMRYRAAALPVCAPGLVARAYAQALDVSMNGSRCLPACQRTDFSYRFRARPRNARGPGRRFRLAFAFRALEYEQYEQVLATTLPGLVSQVGGQLNLFLGVTCLTLVQAALSAAVGARQRWRGVRRLRLAERRRRG